MSIPEWFSKKSEKKKQEYCNDHLNSEVCRAYFGFSGAVSSQTERREGSVSNSEVTTQVVEVSEESEAKNEKEIEHHYYDTKKDYAWAKKSNVTNLGEDIEGSKRHTRNMLREWGDFSSQSSLEVIMSEYFDHKHLKKQGATQLTTQDEKLAPHYWIIVKVLDTYPAFDSYRMDKLQWAKDYHYLLEGGKTIADQNQGDVKETYKQFVRFIYAFIQENAQYRSMRNDVEKPFTHRNSPITKLLTFLNLGPSRYSPERNLDMLGHALKEDEGLLSKIKDVLNGKTVGEALGIESKKRDDFKPEIFYQEFVPTRVDDLDFKNFSEVKDFLSDGQFKIRGLQFGNSLKDKEREQFAIVSAMCLKDLSDVLDIEPNVLTGNGSLAVAIGARGGAGALAHYEPGHQVINMSKNGGGGAFAHEMGHFLDNMLARNYLGEGSKMAFPSRYTFSRHDDREFAEMTLKLKDISAKVTKRIEKDERFSNCSSKQRKWALDSAECFARAFEAYVARRADEKGVKNNYLVTLPKHYFWPTEEELDEYASIFESVTKLLKKKLSPESEQKQAIAG